MPMDIVWVGTADYVAEKIEKAREEVGLQHIMLAMPFFGLPFEKVPLQPVRDSESMSCLASRWPLLPSTSAQ